MRRRDIPFERYVSLDLDAFFQGCGISKLVDRIIMFYLCSNCGKRLLDIESESFPHIQNNEKSHPPSCYFTRYLFPEQLAFAALPHGSRLVSGAGFDAERAHWRPLGGINVIPLGDVYRDGRREWDRPLP